MFEELRMALRLGLGTYRVSLALGIASLAAVRGLDGTVAEDATVLS